MCVLLYSMQGAWWTPGQMISSALVNKLDDWFTSGRSVGHSWSKIMIPTEIPPWISVYVKTCQAALGLKCTTPITLVRRMNSMHNLACRLPTVYYQGCISSTECRLIINEMHSDFDLWTSENVMIKKRQISTRTRPFNRSWQMTALLYLGKIPETPGWIFSSKLLYCREKRLADRQKIKACAHLVCQQNNNSPKRGRKRYQHILTTQTLCSFHIKTRPTDLQPVNVMLFNRALTTPNSNCQLAS